MEVDANENITEEDKVFTVTLCAKWGKEKIELSSLAPSTTIAQVKSLISEKTSVLPKRQKLIGLTTTNKRKITDEILLSDLKVKASASKNSKSSAEIRHNFILMGTPEESIFVDPKNNDNLPDVIDDFGLDFNAGSDEWLEHVAKDVNLKKFTKSTKIHIMNEPRENKPLMVLDLDHTLLDFSRKSIQQASDNDAIVAASNDGNHGNRLTAQEAIEKMKRPFMDDFLARMYESYDLVVWSQTSWRWLETKLIELGMLSSTRYKFCFVMDKTSMFTIISTKKSGTKVKHSVKPLQIIWNKFPQWDSRNTVHLDDLSRNFALNLSNGLKVTAYYRKKTKGKRDVELAGLSNYLTRLAKEVNDFTKVNFCKWTEVLAGDVDLIADNEKEDD